MSRDYRCPIRLSAVVGALARIALLIMASCAPKDVMAPAESGSPANADRRIADVDWNKAETVNVVLFGMSGGRASIDAGRRRLS